MTYNQRRLAIIAGVLVPMIALFVIFNSKSKPKIDTSKDYSSYISAYTSGVISTRSTIHVVFASDFAGNIQSGQSADKSILTFSPSIKGELVWTNSRTLELTPYNPLPQDEEYVATVDLSKLISNIPSDFKKFEFAFRTVKQQVSVEIIGIEFYEETGKMERKLHGFITTADYAASSKVKEILKAKQGNTNLGITWESSPDGRVHNFWVENINQGDTPSKIILDWDGNPIEADYSEEQEYEVPEKGVFRILSSRVIQNPDQLVEIRFSEPLDANQNLEGLITSADIYDLKTVIEGNLIKIYPPERQSGSFNFNIAESIKSISGQRLNEAVVLPVQFEVLKPEVRMIGEGVIIPSTEGILFPFQAVSLKAVDVEITRIFEKNIAQFLQVNNLNGDYELRRVGRMILRKTVLLNNSGQTDIGTWNTFHLDLSQLISTEPGAIYQVKLSFRKAYSAYSCNGETSEESINIIEERYDKGDDAHRTYYYEYDDEYYDYWEDYNWDERDNPCHISYYRNREVIRNVIASNIGLIAKGGVDGSMLCVATDLITAKPISGVNLEILNYQQQVLGTASTDNDGMAIFNFKVPDKPFLLIATKENQKGYLKLDDGSSLSLSAFDVSGQAVQRGLKGFIYGERGVWRPGDTLFISFILEDKAKILPDNHPVSFELIDPKGQVVYKTISSNSVDGIYAFPVTTTKDAPTGSYNARVKVGGATYNQQVRIETIMPNRLKLNLDFGTDALKAGRSLSARLNAKWLHGAPARSLKAKVDVTLNKAATTFKNYKDFTFDDPARTFTSEEQNIFDGQLDETGNTSFSPNINVQFSAPGVLKANFVVRVFEEGGNFSIDRFSMPYYPYQTYVGVQMPDPKTRGNMFLTDTVHRVKVVTVNAEGIPVQKNNLNVEVYKISWRWWWEQDSEDLSYYISSSYSELIQKGRVSTNSNGEGEYKLRINHPDWGRFLIRIIDTDGGHATGTTAYFDWPGWVKRDKDRMPEAATMLIFASDKENYNVGDEAKLTIPSSEGGRVLICVENGVNVIDKWWVETEKSETHFSFKVTDRMTPNIYIHATLIQPHAQTANDLPIRLYGIVPVNIENPETHLTPLVELPAELTPEKDVTITVSEKNGREMAATLAVVDEGLLDLTRFRTPDPWNNFYAKEALGVKTWDLFNLVMGAITGKMQSIISIGGDEEIVNKGDRTADRFKPVVKYIGPFKVGSGDKKKVTFKMPNYIGSVRVMVVAAKDGAYGSVEKAVPVRKPLMVLSTLPRVLGPDEEVMLPVTVFAMDKKIKEVKVKVELNELLQPMEELTKTIRFEDIGDQIVKFNLKVSPRLGIGKVKVSVTSGKNEALDETEIDIRNPNPPMTFILEKVINQKEEWNVVYKSFGMEGTNTASIEISTLPPIDLGRRLKWLLEYPHGCLEQTTSGAFPQLFIGKLADFSEEVKVRAQDNVRAGLDKIRNFRMFDGGFSLWPGYNYCDEWTTSYAGHFILEAEALGYSVPSGVLEGWKKFQRQKALTWAPSTVNNCYNNDLMQAYRLYTLALAKAPELGAMNRLREYPTISTSARFRLAAAYALTGNNDAARNLIQGISTSIPDYRETGYTYGSHIRDKAMIAEAMILMKDYEKVLPLLKDLSDQLSKNNWMSTQEISFSLLAFSKYSAAVKSSNDIDVVVSANGKDNVKLKTNLTLAQYLFNPVQKGEGKVSLKNNGNGVVYARLIQYGIPVAGNEVAQNSNLELNVSYHLMNGNEISPDKLEQGTDFFAIVKITNPAARGNNIEQLSLSFIVPSGWEIRNTRMDGTATEESTYTYQDIRDDRVYTYFDLGWGKSKTFKLVFNAAYIGKYYMPPILCEAMYDNTIFSRNTGKWVEVVPK